MRRSARVGRYVLLGVAVGLLIGVITFYILTKTEFGLERVRTFTVGWVSDRFQGKLRIARVTTNGLLGGVTLHRVEIDDPAGKPILRSDSVRLAYKWRTLLGGRVVFDRVDLYQPSLYLTRLPGDSLWNFEYAFRDTTPLDPGTGKDQLVLLEDVRVYNALTEVRMPVEPRGRAIEPRDTARMLLEQTPAGIIRVIRFQGVNASAPRVLWESPAEAGKLFTIRSLSGRGWLYRTPMDVRDLRGTIALRDSLLSFDASRVQFPHTEVAAVGQVIIEDTFSYNVELSSRNLDFRDFDWLYPQLPESGGGRLAFRIQTQPNGGTLWLVENAQLRAPGTNVSGSFGIVTGDSIFFTRVDLRAAPLDVDVVERMLPQKLPIDGLLIGTVRVTGPISALESSGNLRLAGNSTSAGSAVRWAGTMDLSDGHFVARGMRADLERLNLELLRALRPALRAEGRVTGRVEASGDVAGHLRFAANVSHQLPGQVASTLSGRGLWRAATRREPGVLDARFDAAAVDLATLADHFPALHGFSGSVHGPVTLAGPTNALSVDADVATPAGRVRVDGTLNLDAPRPTFDLTSRFTDFQLDRLVRGIPHATFSGSIHAAGSAEDARNADVRGSVHITSGAYGAVPVHAAAAEFALRDGLLAIDSMRLSTAAGSIGATGTFGILPETRGTLRVSLALDTIAALAPLLFDEDAVPGDSLALNGQLRGEAELTGGSASFDLCALAEIRNAAWRGHTAQRTQLAVEATALGTPAAAAHIESLFTSGRVAGRTVDSLRVDVRYAERGAGFAAQASLPAHSFGIEGAVRRSGDFMDASVYRLSALARGSRWELADTSRFSIGRNTLTLSGVSFQRAGAESRVDAGGSLVWGSGTGANDFTFALTQVPAAEWLPLIAPRVDADGAVDARVRIAGAAAAPRVDATVQTARITYGGAPLGRVAGEAAYADRRLTIRMEAQRGGRTILGAHGEVPYDLRMQPLAERRLDEPLSLTLEADSMPAALPLSFFRGYANTAGTLDGAINIGGTTLDPTLGGTMTLTGGGTDIEAAGTRIDNAKANFQLHDDRTVEIDGSFTAGVGGGSVSGKLKFDRLQDPELDLTIVAREMDAARRRDVEVVASGTVHLAGRFASPRLNNVRIRIDRGAMHLDELWREYQVVGLESPLLFDVVDTTRVANRHIMLSVQSPFMRNLVIGGNIDVGRDFWLRSRDLNVEVGGELDVAFNRQEKDLRLNGTLAAVRGSYQLYGRRFQVRDGAVEFHGTPGINPNMEITAEYRVRTAQGDPLDIHAIVTGSLLSPRVRLTSSFEPPISESDLASYLLFGRPTYALASGESQALSFANAGELGIELVAPSVLGYGARALENVGQQLGLDYVAITAGELQNSDADAGMPRLFTETFASSQLEVGRYLGDDLFLALSRRIAGGGADAYGARLEWRLGPILTGELFLEDRFLRQPSFGLDPSLTSSKVYGLFLFREWTF